MAPAAVTSSVSTATAGTPSSPARQALTAQSVTPNGPITIGIITFTGTGAVTNAGLSHVPAVEGQELYNAVIRWYNRHGGFAGHQVRPIYQKYPLVTSTPYATEEQQSCAAFTQDNHVFTAISDRELFDGIVQNCLKAKLVPLYNDYSGYYEQKNLEAWPQFWMPAEPIGETVLNNWVAALVRQHFLTTSNKIGLVVASTATNDDLAKMMPAIMERHGVALMKTAVVATTDQAGISDSVLAFRAAGIDRVLIMDSPPAMTILWPTQAQSQGYYPLYGLNSFNTPAFSASNVTSRVFQGARGIGWWPQEDVSSSNAPPPNEAGKTCLAIYKAENVEIRDSITAGLALQVCGMVQEFRITLLHAGAMTGTAMTSAFDGLGNSITSPITFGTSVGPARHAGARYYRDLAYDNACSCFGYASADRAFQ